MPGAAMAMQAGNAVGPSPQVIGSAFVQQYYQVLYGSPEHVHKFYHDESILGRPDSNGTMTSVTTTHDINEQILSTDIRGCLIELKDVDTQPSHKGGVLILVTGSFTMPDTVKHSFTQSFFLAPQENGGYFVLNDVLRYVPEMPPTEICEAVADNVNDDTQIVPFSAEPETTSVKDSMDSELPLAKKISGNDQVINPSAEKISGSAEVMNPSAENISLNGKVINLSAENIHANDIINTSEADNSQIENCVETSTEVANCDAAKISEVPLAPPASAQKNLTKKSYASIVKIMKENRPPATVAKPKPKPKPTVKGDENVEKSGSITAKPTHAADSAPRNDKIVSHVQGYSVYVRNLPFDTSVEIVEGVFSKFGPIKPGGTQVIKRQFDGFCFGFVEFKSQQSMHAAIEASPIRIGSKDSYVEEKRTTRRVVNGVVIRGDNNGDVRGSRTPPGRGGYGGDNFTGQGFVNNGNYRDGDNFRGHEVGFANNNYRNGDNFRGQRAGFVNNGNHRDGDNMRNVFRNRNEYSDRGRGPQGNKYQQKGNGYQQGYHQKGNEYYQNGNEYNQSGKGYHQNGNGYQQNRNGYQQNRNGYQQNRSDYHQNRYGYQQNRNGNQQNGNRNQPNGDGNQPNGNGQQQNGNGYHESRPLHNENGRTARAKGPRQSPVTA